MSSQIHGIVIGLDPGTKNMRIVAQLLRGDNASPKTTTIDDIYLTVCEDFNDPLVKQIAVFLRNNSNSNSNSNSNNAEYDIVFGAPVRDLLRSQPHLQNETLEFFKLALHQDFDNFREAAHVKEVLNTAVDHGKLQDFFADLIEAVVKGVRDFYKRTWRKLGVSPAAIDAAPVTMQLCVPAIFEDNHRGVMRNAATESGVVRVELREEPLCAAVMGTQELLRYGNISAGQCSLLVDCGSGTLDISVTRLDNAPSEDQEMVLSRIGICSGNSAGSQMLNHQLFTYLTSGNHPGIDNCKEFSASMGLTEYEFLRQASEAFDIVKKDFPGRGPYYGLNIYGSDGVEHFLYTIHLPHQLVESWYNIWIAKATQLLRDHIEHVTEWVEKHGNDLNLTCAVFSGGGMNCRLLSTAMDQVLQESGYELDVMYLRDRLACARGALLHHTFQEDTLPSRMRFFVCREEHYQKEIHGDNSKRKQSKWRKTNTVLATDRIARVMDFDNGAASNQKLVPMEFRVADGGLGGRLHIDLFWTENDVEDHAPFKDRKDKLLKGIRSFPLVWADLEDLSRQGFKAVDGQGFGGRHFVVRAWVALEIRNDTLVLVVKLMRPGYRHPWKANGKLRQKTHNKKTRREVPQRIADLAAEDVFKTREIVVWTKDSSHFITNSTGTCISRGDHIEEDIEYHLDYRMEEDIVEGTGDDAEGGSEGGMEDDAEGSIDEGMYEEMDEVMGEDEDEDMDEDTDMVLVQDSNGVIDLTQGMDDSEDDED